VRRRAISYVSWHDSSWAVAEIMRLCDDQQPDVKWAAVEALVAMRPSDAYDHLELMMPSLAPAYQRRAAALLARRNSSTTSVLRRELLINPRSRDLLLERSRRKRSRQLPRRVILARAQALRVLREENGEEGAPKRAR